VSLDQDSQGKQGRRIRREDDVDVWTRDLAEDGRCAIAVLNRGSEDREVRIALAELGIEPRTHVRVRDLWQRTDVGVMRREIVITTSAVSATVLGIAGQ
jgi:hypothetical protein